MRRKEKTSPDLRHRVRCAIYTRRATEAARDGGSNSIEAQRERAAAHIDQRLQAWEIHPERYDDRGYSGTSTDRPALRRLLRDAAAGKFQMVVVCEITRLTRSLADLLSIVETLNGVGVPLATVTEELNTSTSTGRMTLNLLLNTCRHSLRKPS